MEKKAKTTETLLSVRIPTELHRSLKAYVGGSGLTIQKATIEGLREYLKKRNA